MCYMYHAIYISALYVQKTYFQISLEKATLKKELCKAYEAERV